MEHPAPKVTQGPFEPKPLDDLGALKPQLAETLAAFPLRPGSSWTYHITQKSNWREEESILTRSVEATYQPHPFALTVAIHEQASWLSFPRFGSSSDASEPYGLGELPRLIEITEGAFTDLENKDVDATFLRPEQRPGDYWTFPPSPFPRWEVEVVEEVTVPAGKFTDCQRMVHREAYDSFYQWFCPGVGFVRYQRCAIATMSWIESLWEMTSYRLGP